MRLKGGQRRSAAEEVEAMCVWYVLLLLLHSLVYYTYICIHIGGVYIPFVFCHHGDLQCMRKDDVSMTTKYSRSCALALLMRPLPPLTSMQQNIYIIFFLCYFYFDDIFFCVYIRSCWWNFFFNFFFWNSCDLWCRPFFFCKRTFFLTV